MPHVKYPFLPLSLALFLTIFVYPFSCVAVEDTAPVEDLLKLTFDDLIDVKVSIASQFDERQIKAGSTTAVITESQWQAAGARRLTDAIGHLPSTIVLPGIFGSEHIYIRGYADTANGSGVATLWDGVSVTMLEASPQFTLQNIQLGTLDRIEMIRGPGSALYGANAFHGVMALNSFTSQTDVTRTSANYASNGFYNGAVKHSQSLGDGSRLNFSVAASGQPDQNQAYDYISSAGGQTASGTREMSFGEQTAVLKFNTDTSRQLSYYAGLYYNKNNQNKFQGYGTSVAPPSTDYSIARRDVGSVDATFAMLQSGGHYRINDLTQAELKLYYFTQNRTFDRSAANNRDYHTVGDEGAYGSNLIFKQTELFNNTQWSLNLGARSAKMNSYVARTTDYITGAIVNNPRLTGPQPISDLKRDIYSAALDATTNFAEGRYELRYGGRYDNYSDFGNAFSPRLGFIYQPKPETAIKLLYGHAFRAPNAGEIRGFPFVGSNPDVQPETIDTYELAWMTQTRNSLTELTFFRSFMHNMIVLGPLLPSGAFCCYLNSGESSSGGVELAYTYQAEPWQLALSGSFVQSTNDTTGVAFVAFPKWILNAGIGYKFYEQGIDVMLNNRVHLNAAEGQVASSLPNPAPLKDFWRTDLHIAKHWSKSTTLTADVRNLFNRDNFIPSEQAQPSVGGVPDERISVMLGLQSKF